MRQKLIFIITEDYTYDMYLRDWISKLTVEFDVCVCGNFSYSQLSLFEKKHSSIVFHDIGLSRKVSLYSDLVSFLKIRRLMNTNKDAIFCALMPKSLFVSAIANFGTKSRLVSFLTGNLWLSYRKSSFKAKAFRWIEDFVIKNSSLVIFDSKSQLDLALKIRPKLNYTTKLQYINSFGGVDLNKFRPDSTSGSNFRINLNLPLNAVVISHAGRLSKRKGTDVFLQFASLIMLSIPQVYIVVAGPVEDESLRIEIERLQSQYPDRFVFCEGFFNNASSIFNGSDLIVMPSLWEGFGLLAAQSACCGTPVLGFKVVGLVDSVKEDFTGWLVDPGCFDKLLSKGLSVCKQSLSNSSRLNISRVASTEFSQEIFLKNFKHNLRMLIDND